MQVLLQLLNQVKSKGHSPHFLVYLLQKNVHTPSCVAKKHMGERGRITVSTCYAINSWPPYYVPSFSDYTAHMCVLLVLPAIDPSLAYSLHVLAVIRVHFTASVSSNLSPAPV